MSVRKQLARALFLLLLCPAIASALTPQITVSASAIDILGANTSISITVTLIDPNHTGMLKVLPNIVPPSLASSATPGTTATVGPIYGNDVILDAFGNANSTYYKVQVFKVTGGIIASTPSLQNFYAFQGSGTVDLSTATPLAPSFMSGANGSVNIPGTLTVNGASVLTNPVNLATQVTGTLAGANYAAVNLAAGNVNGGATGTLPAANLPATTGQCTGVQFSRGQAAGGSENCATPPAFVASGASHAVGYVPDPGASPGTTHFLREDSTWAIPSSAADATFGWGMFGQTLSSTLINCSTASGSQSCVQTVLPAAHTIVRLTYQLQVSPSGCTTGAVIGVRDLTSATTLTSLTVANGTAVGFVDSGALSVATTAGHILGVGQITASSGCGTNAIVFGLTAVYQ